MNTPTPVRPKVEHKPDNIVLCGFMGTGKSTVGRIIAIRLGWRFTDTDKLIETRQGRTISAIFAEQGEAAFRAMESALCIEISGWQKTVVATGGGIVLNPANRANLIRAGLVVCLDTPAEDIVQRLANQTDRPLLAGPNPTQRIAELLAARAEAYGALPYHVNTANSTPELTAQTIIDLWKRHRR